MNFYRYLLILLLVSAGCSQPSDKIIIATAANVQYVMQDIKKEFEKETGKPIEIVVSSSGKLTTQIREGAPFDVFVSADTKYPNEIFDKGGAEEKPRVYASGTLVIWSKALPSEKLSADFLADASVKKIAIPNPEVAPYGAAALAFLKKRPDFEQIKAKLVYGESISQTAQYISSGTADIGFNALSIVLAPEMKGKGIWVEVDSSLYEPIEQAAILLRHSDNSPKKETSEQFYKFLYSAKAKAIFKKYGYK